MTEEDFYFTVTQETEVKLNISRSVFIAIVKEAKSAQEARAFFKEKNVSYADATHYCSAFRVRQEKEIIEFYSDGGEPAGSAGKPILEVLSKNNLTDTALIVIRYFGGKKLGLRGLREAYASAAALAVEKAGMKRCLAGKEYAIFCNYIHIKELENIFQRLHIIKLEENYSLEVYYKIKVPFSKIDSLKRMLPYPLKLEEIS